MIAHLAGDLTLDEALDEARRRTRRFARRQQRWFGRDPRIHWIEVDADRLPGDPSVLSEVEMQWP